jgi:hypothetical protein
MNLRQMNTVPDASESIGEIRPARLVSANRLIRAAVHVACWVPFITTAADSWRGPWRAIGDNAHLALQSWDTLSSWMPLYGQSNELPHAPHDLGPLQYWLLTIPVHADTGRGVLWGAVLLAMLAVSLTVEAGYSVAGEMGGLLAGGVVIAIVTWFPGFATRPEDNPNFGLIYFIPTLAACLAVLSGHRKWWPVLVVTASIAAQAHLTFAAASVGLVLIAVVTGLIDEFRAKGGYSWLIAGLIAGAACWFAPLVQQFGSPPGKGNMWLLLHAENAGRHVGVAYAMKAMATLAAPSPLWWQQNIGQRQDLFQVLGSKPAAFGVVILAITAASLVVAVCWLRSRELAGLAAISLLVSVAAAASFALIPAARGLAGQQHDLVFVMFVAVLLAWLTVICVIVSAAVKLISDRRGRAGATEARAPSRQQLARQNMIPLAVRGAAALLLVTTVLLGAVQQVANYQGAGENSSRVGAALAKIERSVPRQQMFALTVSSARKADKFQVISGLCWALAAHGYKPAIYHPGTTFTGHSGTLPKVTVALRGRRTTVRTVQIPQRGRGRWSLCNSPE